MAKKRRNTVEEHRCGECANVTPVMYPRHLLNVRGEPTLGTCPHWTESRCVLLSWRSSCTYYAPKGTADELPPANTAK